MLKPLQDALIALLRDALPELFGGGTPAATPAASRAIALPGAAAADAHENVHPIKQVVVRNPPQGTWEVEVSSVGFPMDAFNQQNLQPFALVFAGTGDEVRFNQPLAAVQGAAIY